MSVAVLTIVRNRSAHLRELIVGLCRSTLQPDELVIVDMSDVPVETAPAPFPIHVERLITDGLPLAAARNRAAALARFDNLIFLDVDCMPLRFCVEKLVATLSDHDALLCADVRYLGPEDARGAWTEEDLLATGSRHPARVFPEQGIREEHDPGLFWSLAFALRRERFRSLGGFHEGFTGYGAEDTDFGFRASRNGCKLLFVGGAIACHQYHDSYDPPVQHVVDIVRNARLFRDRWGKWPMEGWLDAFARLGLVSWQSDKLELLRLPSETEIAAARISSLSSSEEQSSARPEILESHDQSSAVGR